MGPSCARDITYHRVTNLFIRTQESSFLCELRAFCLSTKLERHSLEIYTLDDPAKPTIMTTINVQLFAPGLYGPNTAQCATGLASDIRLRPEIRKAWAPEKVFALVNDTAVGRYFKYMENVILMIP